MKYRDLQFAIKLEIERELFSTQRDTRFPQDTLVEFLRTNNNIFAFFFL